MSDFFNDERKNKLAEIAKASEQWELMDAKKKGEALFQVWICTYKYPQAFRVSSRSFSLSEGFDDDEARYLEFKQALVESITTNQQRTDILFEKLYGDRQMFLGE